MTITKTFSRARGLLCTTAALAVLAACGEEEIILRGEREDIRPDAAVEVVNQARPISLPAQAANAEWAQGHGAEAGRTAHPALSAAPQRIWSASIGEGDSRRQRIIATPVVGGGRIYTLDSAAQVSAVSPQGQVLWQSELIPAVDDEGQATGGGLAYDNGVLYISSGFGVLTALSAADGSLIWRQELGATGSGQPRVSGGLVYLVAGDDTGWAVNTKDGRIAWQIEASPSAANILGALSTRGHQRPCNLCLWLWRPDRHLPPRRPAPLERVGRRSAHWPDPVADQRCDRGAGGGGQAALCWQQLWPDRGD